MKQTTTQDTTFAEQAPVQPQLASRRRWLRGLGALLGAGVLAAPTAVLASPGAPAGETLSASALAGGDEYIGMVKLLAGPDLPTGWALCDGRLLPAAQHPALFALLKDTYGGDGRHTFALPNLSGPLAGDSGAAALLCAIKVANGPATTTALAELQLEHQRRTRPRVA
ncbi:phage tail protein [Hymenobacter convexus]|uniref:phage tail protein n=1 Tax=Hymenobacter sp. CA1UV-4 TaxID=3063782 RepID=UPI00350EB284